MENILIILMDDVGVEQLDAYGTVGGTNHTRPSTPHIDQLAAEGVTFNYAYSNPVCSASRAAIQTGRPAYRTGVTSGVTDLEPVVLAEGELTIPEMLSIHGTGHSTAYFGKWHLVSTVHPDYLNHPNRQGWGYFSGESVQSAPDYYLWDSWSQGVVTPGITTYMMTQTFADAADWIATAPEPWFVMVAPKPPHTPSMCPPVDYLTGCNVAFSKAEVFQAVVAAIDTEIGDLRTDLATLAIDDHTTLIVMSDNGTYESSISPTTDVDTTRMKGTVYELGTRIPLIVHRPSDPSIVVGGTTNALVQTTDLFATVVEMAGATLTANQRKALDSKRIVPLLHDLSRPGRDYVYSELTTPLARVTKANPLPYSEGSHAVRNANYRLVKTYGQSPEFYNMAVDGDFEVNDLGVPAVAGPDLTNYNALMAALTAAYTLP